MATFLFSFAPYRAWFVMNGYTDQKTRKDTLFHQRRNIARPKLLLVGQMTVCPKGRDIRFVIFIYIMLCCRFLRISEILSPTIVHDSLLEMFIRWLALLWLSQHCTMVDWRFWKKKKKKRLPMWFTLFRLRLTLFYKGTMLQRTNLEETQIVLK